MNKSQKLKLIDGYFSPEESREILLNVFSNKIQFHQMKNFSSQERFGKDDNSSVKRIPQLKKSIDKLLKIIDAAEKKGDNLEVKSEVIISIIENK